MIRDSDTQKIRVRLFGVFAAMGVIGALILAFGPHLSPSTWYRTSESLDEPQAVSLPISEGDAILALRQIGVDVRVDENGESANYVMVFQEFLFGDNGYHRFSDADMKYIAALERLEELHIVETQITDESLASLMNQPRIRRITLRNRNLTDSAIAYIRELPRLDYLNISHTSISLSGVRTLHDHFPDCEIISDYRPDEVALKVDRLTREESRD